MRAGHSAANPKYFGPDRGVTFYGHLADIYMPFGRQQVISTNDREALYVLDTLCHHDTDFAIREHFTDTAGYTEQVFGLCMLLGFQFAPRIRDVLDQRLYTLSGIGVPGALQSLVTARIRTRLIVEHWAELRRLAASIQQGTVSAALLLRKLAAYPRQNRLAQALAEVGKLEKTLFILEYLRDESLRRRVQVGLNKGEAKHALGRALFFGRHGELWERAVTAQVHRASGLHLLIAGIGAWNTVYLGQALAALAAEGQAVPAEYLPHMAPLGWEHINLLGHYSFESSAPGSLEQLRPLRKGGDSDSMEEELPSRAVRKGRQRAAMKRPRPAPPRATHAV
jgi:TnpA family transposase